MMLSDVPVSHSASTVPNSASTAPNTMASGSQKRPELDEQHGEDQDDRHHQDERPGCGTTPAAAGYSPPYSIVPGGSDVSRPSIVPDLGHGAAEVAAFEAGGHGDVLPQVLAPQFELPGSSRDVGHLRRACTTAAVRRAQRQVAQGRRAGRCATGSARTRTLYDAVAFEHRRGGLAEHRGVHGVGDVVGAEAEPLRRPRARTLQAERRAGVHQAVEGVDHAGDLLDAVASHLRRLLLQEGRCRSRRS